MGEEFDGEGSQLHRPLDDSAIGFSVVKYVAEGEGGKHLDVVRLEVVAQLPGRDEDRVEEFLHLRIAQLELTEYFTDEVDGSVYFVDMARLVSFDDQGSADHVRSCHDI